MTTDNKRFEKYNDKYKNIDKIVIFAETLLCFSNNHSHNFGRQLLYTLFYLSHIFANLLAVTVFTVPYKAYSFINFRT